MLPPYTNCLGDYFNSGANRVQVKAILRDISRYDKSLNFSLSVKVKVGNTVVLESVTPYPIQLSNANVINDLREYVPLLFSPAADNKGVRASGNYATNGYCLPEGSYEFVFQVFDFYKKNVPLSEPFSMFCYLNQAEAPVAVYPEDGACGIGSAIGISEAGVQFQWMDPIAYGPSNKMYEFVLTEKGSGSNLVGNMFSDVSEDNSLNLPVFSDKVYNNTFRYVPATSGTFVKGKEYCWYVVAKGGNITGEKDDHYAFKNKGKSNVNCFIYGDCPEKEKIFDDSKVKKTDDKLKVVLEKVDVDNDKKNAEATWKSETGDFCKYYVYYYRKDLSDASAEKAEIKDLTSLSTVLNNLEPGYEYSCYVIGATNCDKEGEAEVLSPKSNELSFKLEQQKEDDKCDANLSSIVCENLLEELNKKDYFFGATSGEIVTVTEVTKNTDNSFTGKGIVSCSIFKNKLGFNVTFDNIFINTERYLCKGEVKVVHDDVDNLVINLNEAAGKKQGAEKAKQQEHLGTEINSLEEAKNYPNQTVIFKGELYAVDADGNYLVVGKVVEKDKLCPTPKGGLDNEDGTVLFDVEKGLNGDKYDPYIDKSPSPFQAELVKKSYEWQASTYPIAWVSMVEGEVRWITAELSGKKEAQSNLKIEDVDFYCYAADSSAVKLEKKVYGNKVMFKVYGGKKNTSLKIYARKNAEKVDGECPNNEKTLGVVNIYSMSHQTKKILLAPVLNEMTLDNLQQMQDDVNKMFAPLGKTFEFTIGAAFTAQDEPELEFLLMDGINTTDGAKHFSKETDEMRYIRQRYTQFASDFSDYDACLFLIPTAQKEGLQGYMPLNKRVGYIIVGENDNVKLDANTIAHELCHGLYDIQHVFDYKGVGEGTLPENIMDYPELNSNISERYLTKYYQWVGVENGQLIHLSFLDDTEDAEGYSMEFVKCMKNAVFHPIKTGGICLLKAAVQTAFEEGVDAILDKINPPKQTEVHWFDRYCWIPFVEDETEQEICGIIRKYGVNAYTCLKDQCKGENPYIDNIASGLNDFLNCAYFNEPTRPWKPCLCESGGSFVFGLLKDLFISPKIDWKIKDINSKGPEFGDKLVNDLGYRFQSVLTSLSISLAIGDDSGEMASQIIRAMLSKDEQQAFVKKFCGWLLDTSNQTQNNNGSHGTTSNGGQVTTNNGNRGTTSNGGQVTTNNGNHGTTNNGGQAMTNNGGSLSNNNNETESSTIKATVSRENVTKEMAVKVFTNFLYDMMSSEQYRYYSGVDFHDTYTYKKLIKQIKDKNSYYYTSKDQGISSKQDIYDLICKLIEFAPIEVAYTDKTDYVRKVCALVASKLYVAPIKDYTIEDFNKIPKAHGCTMCNFDRCKGFTQVLDLVQRKCHRSMDNAYNVLMFLVDDNYMTLPYILKHIDE